MKVDVLEKVREFVRNESEKHDAKYKGSYDNHIKIVVARVLKLADKERVDKEIVEIAAWLHDIGSIMGDRENHHIVGAEVADKLLRELGYPHDRIEKVKHCILAHRGSVTLKRETPEAQILADADSMSHFDDLDGILTRVFDGDKKEMLKKLERSYAKLSNNLKNLIIEKLEKFRRNLE